MIESHGDCFDSSPGFCRLSKCLSSRTFLLNRTAFTHKIRIHPGLIPPTICCIIEKTQMKSKGWLGEKGKPGVTTNKWEKNSADRVGTWPTCNGAQPFSHTYGDNQFFIKIKP